MIMDIRNVRGDRCLLGGEPRVRARKGDGEI